MAALVLLVLLLLAGPAYPQPTQGAIQVPPKDTNERWVVGFTAFIGRNLSPEHAYLVFSIPLLLRDHVNGVTRHRFDPSVAGDYRRALIRRELTEQYESLRRLRAEADEQLFSASSSAAAEADLERRIGNVTDRIRYLEVLDPDTVELPSEKPIAFKEGAEAGKLLESPRYSPLSYCRDHGIDLLIWGEVEESQGYVRYTINAFEAATERNILAFVDAAPVTELYQYLGECDRDLARAVLGRDYATLTIVPVPAQSSVFIDDVLCGTGSTMLPFLEPGVKQVRVSSPGYADQTFTTTLAPFEQKEEHVELVRTITGTVTVESQPVADVYVNSVWKGKTPLVLDRPAIPQKVLLRTEGYLDVPFHIGRDSPDTVSITLQKSTVPPEQLQREARDGFYLSFGLFALSLPFPLFLYGLTSDAAEALRRAPGSDSLRLAGNIYYYSCLGTLAVSAGLFGYTIFSLLRYIALADRTSG